MRLPHFVRVSVPLFSAILSSMWLYVTANVRGEMNFLTEIVSYKKIMLLQHILLLLTRAILLCLSSAGWIETIFFKIWILSSHLILGQVIPFFRGLSFHNRIWISVSCHPTWATCISLSLHYLNNRLFSSWTHITRCVTKLFHMEPCIRHLKLCLLIFIVKVNVKLSLCLTKLNAMKEYEEIKL
jgi:hypothetical protein